MLHALLLDSWSGLRILAATTHLKAKGDRCVPVLDHPCMLFCMRV